MNDSADLARLWPAAGLRVQAGDLELRWLDDPTLVALADLASRGVHAPDFDPFGNGWTKGTPLEVARSVLTFQWSRRGQVSGEKLNLELGVVLDGVPVGIQALHGENWSVLRQISTGSWLGLEYQGRGIGKRMRALILDFAFGSLGAVEATTTAFADNAASNAVSRHLRYEADGTELVARNGIAAVHNRHRMSRDRWLEVRDEHARIIGAPVVVHGLAPLLEQIG